MTRAFSYVRFSTPDQLKGDSLRRQLAASKAYAEAHGLELDDSLKDLGLSAFDGDNRTKGALATFLKKVESGAIPRGSVLLVESLDRLSREQVMDAQCLFLSIIRAGIKVVTLMDGQEYDEASINANFAQLIMSLVIMSRAHEESLTKSKRGKDYWKGVRIKADEGCRKPGGRKPPNWLRKDGDRFVRKPKEAAAIECMFQMYVDGVGGPQTIAKKLNNDPIYRDCNGPIGWYKSYIERVLKDRNVLGEWQPHKYVGKKRVPVGDPILDYYPRIIDDDLFYQAQAKRTNAGATAGHGGGRNTSIANLFSHGMLRCVRCGGKVDCYSKGRKPKGFHYLQCEKARRGITCNEHKLNYDKLEPLLLHWTRGLNPRDVLGSDAERNRIDQRRIAIEGHIQQIEREIEEYLDSIVQPDNASIKRRLEARIRDREVRLAELEAERDARESTNLKTPEAVVKHLEDVEALIAHMDQLEGDELTDLRRRLRSKLHQLIDRIEIDPGQHRSVIRVYFRDANWIGLLLDANGGLRLARTKGKWQREVKVNEAAVATLRHRQIDLSAYIGSAIRPPGRSSASAAS